MFNFYLGYDNVEDKNGGIFNTVKDIFTFNLFATYDVKVIPKHPTVFKMIQDNLYKIIETFINCWELSANFKGIADLKTNGTHAYSFNRFNGFNKSIPQRLALLSEKNSNN